MSRLEFSFEGQLISAEPGDSIAAALAAAGVRTLGNTRTGRDRGVFCGMGTCQECLVTVGGTRSVRACMTEVTDGMVVAKQADLETPVMVQNETSPEPVRIEVDLLILGAGPAGLNAAVAASGHGHTILVLDERSAPGGQYFKPQTTGHRVGQKDSQHRAGDALRSRFAACGATLKSGATVWHARAMSSSFEIGLIEGIQQTVVSARAVILATGAYERPAVFPGWTLPSVMTIGAAQTYARRYGVVPGGRVLIAGQGPLGLQLANELLDLGANVVGVAERSAMRLAPLLRASLLDPRLGLTGAQYLLGLKRRGVPLWTRTEIAGVSGTQVTLATPGGSMVKTIEADVVCAGDGFLPQLDLARLLGCPVSIGADGTMLPERNEVGATPVSGLWIAGDAGGLGGAQVAALQGELCGVDATKYLGGEIVAPRRSHIHLARARAFQRTLWDAYAAPRRDLPSGETIVCRCENVTAAQIHEAMADGCSEASAVKRVTRCGMGRCQGRFCLPTLGQLLDEPQAFTAQLPSQPIPVVALSREKPEWGGHSISAPSARPYMGATEPLRVTSVDIVVIGAGVTGLCAARQAVKHGASCLVLDRGRVAAEASGGNAGSLHLQLLSWDFGSKAMAGGSPQLMTLPLQKRSIARWSEIETALGADFEMRVTGGLMLAEDKAQIAFLQAKAKAEKDVGIDTEVVDADEIRRISPHISDRFVAAAWCAGEGKINPLLANHALAKAARNEGVQIAEGTEVTDMTQEGLGYLVHTSRGDIRAKKVVIAAGGWSAQLGRMLGVELPIHGAPLQMIVTEPCPPLVSCLVAHADRHLTLKQTDVGTILIGGAWPSRVGPDRQPQVMTESLEGNLWVAARTVPAISGLSLTRSWAAMNIDIDGAPLLSPLPGHPGVVVAATANGYTLGPVIGEAAADIALSGSVDREMSRFTLSRF